MPFLNGRQVKVYEGDVATGTLVAGARTKTVNFNNEPIDVTTDDASGFRTLLSTPGQKSLDFSAEGLLFDDSLLSIAAGSTGLLTTYTVEIEGIGSVAGDFFLNSFETGAEYNGNVTFTGSFQSSGEFTYTVAL